MRFTIRSKSDLEKAIEKYGFLPYFRNPIESFSLEEHIRPEYWFGECEGAWEWKGPVIRDTGCGYGKFFDKKAVFVSREFFPDLANFRRDGYDLDARYEDGLARHSDKVLYDIISENCPVISKQAKVLGNYGKNGVKGFESGITRLQEQCYVIISDFVYMTDKNGRQYGWGVAEYSTPESFMGSAFTDHVYDREPAESRARIKEHLVKLLGRSNDALIDKLLG